MNLAISFFKTAKDDLITSKTLYDMENYASSVFHLQQAVEKLTKAYALFGDVVEVDRLKRISHNPEKVFKKQIRDVQEKFDQTALLEEMSPGFLKFQVGEEEMDLGKHIQQSRDGYNFINQLSAKQFFGISSSAFDAIKNQIDQIDTEPEIDFEVVMKRFPDVMNTIVDQIASKIGIDPTRMKETFGNKAFISEIEDCCRYAIPLALKQLKINLNLFYLSLITSAHNQRSRYPCLCCGETPQELYTKELTIVKRYDEIHKIFTETDQMIKEVFIDKEAML